MTVPEFVTGVLNAGWNWLELQHSALPWILIPVLAWLVNWAIRTWVPGLWEWLTDRIGPRRAGLFRKLVQAAPSVATGAVIVALAKGEPYGDIVQGALVALGAPLWHEVLKWATSKLPGPTYRGGSFPAAGGAPPKSRKPGGPGSVVLVLLCALALTGCASTLTEARSERLSAAPSGKPAGPALAAPERCESLDDRRTLWGAVAKGSAFLAGGNGLGAVTAPEDPPELRTGLGIAGAAFGALAAGAMWLEQASDAAWVRECER